MAVLAGALLSALLLNTSMAASAYAKYDLSNELGPARTRTRRTCTAELDAQGVARAARRRGRGARHGAHQRHRLAPARPTAACRARPSRPEPADDDVRSPVARAPARARTEQTASVRARQPRDRPTTVPRQRPRGRAADRRRPARSRSRRRQPPAGPSQPGSRGRMAFLTDRRRPGARRLRRAARLRPGPARAEHRRARHATRGSSPSRCSAGAARSPTRTASRWPTSVERYDISVEPEARRGRSRARGPSAVPTVPAGVAARARAAARHERRRARRHARRRPAVRLHPQGRAAGGRARGPQARPAAASTWTGSPSASTRTARSPGTSSASSTPTASGLAGLEASLDERLHRHGRAARRTRAAARARRSPAATRRTPRRRRATVQLTLMSRRAVEGAGGARRAGRRHRVRTPGSLIVMDAKTGEIYALADSGTRRPQRPGRLAGRLAVAARSPTCSSPARPARSSRWRPSSRTASPTPHVAVPGAVHVLAGRQRDVQGLARARGAAT